MHIRALINLFTNQNISAMKTTKYFLLCFSLEEVKKKYKELAMIHHPDRGGNTEIMQQINAEYESIVKNAFFNFPEQSEEDQAEFIKYPEIINKLVGLDGIIIELIGTWIWLSGNTYEHRAEIKLAGFFYASQKAMWYYRPPDYKSTNREPKSIEFIRFKYGSDIISNKQGKYALIS